MRSGSRLLAVQLALAFALGCATAEDVDDGVVPAGGGAANDGGLTDGKVDNPKGGSGGGTQSGGSGGAGDGGTSADGGATTGGTNAGGAGGGASGSGGASTGGSGGGSGGSCASGQKKCGGVCLNPTPGIGCNLTDCQPCPNPPANSNSSCTGTMCDFTCLAGYTKQGSSCVSSGGGGGSGGGGSGGTGGGSGCPAPCNPNDGQSQFICASFCLIQGKFGLCAPVINCCVCS